MADRWLGRREYLLNGRHWVNHEGDDSELYLKKSPSVLEPSRRELYVQVAEGNSEGERKDTMARAREDK